MIGGWSDLSSNMKDYVRWIYIPTINKIERGRLMLPPSILFANRLALLFSKLVLVVICNRITIA